MKDSRKITFAALFAALTCAATMVIRIPTFSTGGYIHPGDALVILSGVFLGPACGGLSAGIGSAMSDLLGGYFFYAPITFLVKSAIAFLTGKALQFLIAHKKSVWMGIVVGGLLDIALVILGYGIYETILYGLPAAVASALPNLIQGIGGLVLSIALYPVLSTIPNFSYGSGKAIKRRK
ncbi:MAG: ECF transporter S component [Lachnospiraceae bacterium]|nr:ECF transporter S component [Lachnospiraceae bacterium]